MTARIKVLRDAGTCPCGLPERHYTDPRFTELMDRMVADFGPAVRVVYEGRTYLVDRHYIALHGLLGADLPDLGFPTVGTPESGV